jgi:hypothetical protein
MFIQNCSNRVAFVLFFIDLKIKYFDVFCRMITDKPSMNWTRKNISVYVLYLVNYATTT